MCDYSLNAVKSRPAVVGDKLTTFNWGTGTTGFTGPEDETVAVCCLPGTEIAFDAPVRVDGYRSSVEMEATVAIFRQVDKDQPMRHHDCLEFPNGTTVFLHQLACGQRATVLQLPAAPKTEAEKREQTRAEYKEGCFTYYPGSQLLRS